MKKVLGMTIVMFGSLVFAQEVTKQVESPFVKNNFYVGAGTSGLGFTTVEDSKSTSWNVGVQGGYFVIDRLAVVATASLEHFSKNDEVFTYGGGLKYYIEDLVPVQVDYLNKDHFGDYLGFQGGYAFKVANNFTIEPNVKYNVNLATGGKNFTSGGVEFNYFFK